MTAFSCFPRCPAHGRDVDVFSVDFSEMREEGVVGIGDSALRATLIR
jgi:hypothetical protein